MPLFSMKRPSRGLRESATTTRYWSLLHAHAHQADPHGHDVRLLLSGGGPPVPVGLPSPVVPVASGTGAVYRCRPILRRRLGVMQASCFIMRRASSNCLRTALTCWVVVPEPRAMRA